uniref:Uncharacterized protein n=1 Tax=Arundo donax TaxID=35708 RepID=A0A0A9BAX9_ARUDO
MDSARIALFPWAWPSSPEPSGRGMATSASA